MSINFLKYFLPYIHPITYYFCDHPCFRNICRSSITNTPATDSRKAQKHYPLAFDTTYGPLKRQRQSRDELLTFGQKPPLEQLKSCLSRPFRGGLFVLREKLRHAPKNYWIMAIVIPICKPVQIKHSL